MLHRCIQMINRRFLVSCCILENNKRFNPILHTDICFYIIHPKSPVNIRFRPLIHYHGIIHHDNPLLVCRDGWSRKWKSVSYELKIPIHSRWSTPTSLILVQQITLSSEFLNFDNVSSSQPSHCCGLSISVLWTMIIHARFLIKTCHHASHFYALNKHNYLCIRL